MFTIWKFQAELGLFKLKLPRDFKLLEVREQHGKPQLWVMLCPDRRRVDVEFLCVPTGVEIQLGEQDDPVGATTEHRFSRQLKHVGTFHLQGGTFVFHLFRTWMPGDECDG